MAKKYCKKSSLTSVADEVRTRNGTSAQIPFANIATTISNLAIPTQRGAPSTVLTASNPSTTIQKGKYTGGSVSVVPQNATATLTQNGGYVSIESGKTLASVTVPASNLYTVATGTFTTTKGATSISVTGFGSITPKGIIICMKKIEYISDNGRIAGIICTSDGIREGRTAATQEKYGGTITGATASFSNGSVSISNISAVSGSSSFSATFWNKEYQYMVWG